MERKATNLEQAKGLFDASDEPVECTREGHDSKVCNSYAEAEEYFNAGE